MGEYILAAAIVVLGAAFIFAWSRLKEAGKESREYFDNIFDRSPLGIELYDAHGRLLNANRACLAIFGIASREAVKGFNLFEDPNLSEETRKRLRNGEAVEYEAPFDFEKARALRLYDTARSGTIYLYVAITPVFGREKKFAQGYLVQVQDITERKLAGDKIRGQEAFLRKVIDSLSTPFYVIDVNSYTVTLTNRAACEGPLSDATKCYALTHRRSAPCEAGGRHPCPLQEVRKTRRPCVTEHVHYDKDGNARQYEVHGHPVFDEKGNVVQMIEYALDITDRKRLYAKTIIDELTGLYNHRGFFEFAEKQLAVALRNDMVALVMFMDLDNLKRINDTLGHKEGDWALIDVANVLRYTFRESDILARIGGDEFAVFTQEKTREAADTILLRLNGKIDDYNRRTGVPYQLSISVGYSYCTSGTRCSVRELLAQADQNMYKQKREKKRVKAGV